MAEPVSTAATGFAVSKLYYGLSALFCGMVVMFLRNKPTLKNHGRTASGAIVGGVSVGSGVIFGGAVAVWLGMDPNDANTGLAVGGLIGLFAVATISMLANFFDKTEGEDIVEVGTQVRAAVLGKAADKPAEKPAPRKTVARKASTKKAVRK